MLRRPSFFRNSAKKNSLNNYSQKYWKCEKQVKRYYGNMGNLRIKKGIDFGFVGLILIGAFSLPCAQADEEVVNHVPF
jgi:hypothetical protein